MLLLAIVIAQLSDLSKPTSQELINGRCDPFSCVPVLTPPPPPPLWEETPSAPLLGSEWALGKSKAELLARLKSSIDLKQIGIAAGQSPEIVDAYTSTCIVTFYLKPRASGSPVIWMIEGRTTEWAILDKGNALACSSSLLR